MLKSARAAALRRRADSRRRAAGAEPLPRALVADRLVVRKHERTLAVWWHGAQLKSYRVALGGDPVGAKQARGDQRTPEGVYTVVKHRKNSIFHDALELSYPNADDRARAKARAASRPAAGSRSTGCARASTGWARRTCCSTGPTGALR